MDGRRRDRQGRDGSGVGGEMGRGGEERRGEGRGGVTPCGGKTKQEVR